MDSPMLPLLVVHVRGYERTVEGRRQSVRPHVRGWPRQYRLAL